MNSRWIRPARKASREATIESVSRRLVAMSGFGSVLCEQVWRWRGGVGAERRVGEGERALVMRVRGTARRRSPAHMRGEARPGRVWRSLRVRPTPALGHDGCDCLLHLLLGDPAWGDGGG